MKRLLLIEDSKEVIALLEIHAKFFGYQLYVEEDGAKAISSVEKIKPDLVILDVILPGKDGFSICKDIKNSALKNIPIIILSEKNKEIDEIHGLELGADDYMSKPFSPKILFARVRSLLKKIKTKKNSKTIKFNDFIFELDHYLLRKKDMTIPLTLTEYTILKKLAKNNKKVFSRQDLLDGISDAKDQRNIDVHIASLRKKLGSELIQTIRGVGYRFYKNREQKKNF